MSALISALLLLSGLVAPAGLASSQDGQPSDKLLNHLAGWGDFETDTNGDGLADGWQTWRAMGEVRWSLDGRTGRSGASQRFDVGVVSDGKDAATVHHTTKVNNTSRDLRSGQRLTVSWWVRTGRSLSNVTFRAFMEAGSSAVTDTVDLVPQGPLTPVSSWRRMSAKYVIPEGVQWIRLNFRVGTLPGEAQGSVWIDDVSVTSGRTGATKQGYTIRSWLIYPYNFRQDPLAAMERFEGGRFEATYSLAGLQKVRPDGLVALQTLVNYTGKNAKTTDATNLFTWAEMREKYDDWLLRDSAGRLLEDADWCMVDIGDRGYQREWLRRMLAAIEKGRHKWLAFDYLDTDGTNTMTRRRSAKYPTDADWQDAQTRFLQAVMPELHRAGVKVIANIAHTGWSELPGYIWMNLTDGYIYELAFVHTDGGKQVRDPWSSWRMKFLTMTRAPSKVAVIGIRAAQDDDDGRRFGIASYLVGMHEQSYLFYCTSHENQIWHSDLEVPLGRPLGPAEFVEGDLSRGGLLLRRFANGVVLVNPTDNETYTTRLAENFRDLDGRQIFGEARLKPKQGLILTR